MTYSLDQVAAASRLFSAAVFKDMAKTGRSAVFGRLASELDPIRKLRSSNTVGDAFDAVFAVLRVVGQRDEYVYKAALTQRVLLGTHSLNTASMLTEFRAGRCKADLVILNGTATVYEIKSERDSLTRLAEQLDAYRRVFARVFVISSECHVRPVEQIAPDDVGILGLSRRNQITEFRPALDVPERICPVTVLESLRTTEAIELVNSLGRQVPAVSNMRLRAALRDEIQQLDPADLHRAMVRVLKRTRNLAPLSNLVNGLPSSLSAAALSYPIRRQDHERVVKATSTTLAEARGWA